MWLVAVKEHLTICQSFKHVLKQWAIPVFDRSEPRVRPNAMRVPFGQVLGADQRGLAAAECQEIGVEAPRAHRPIRGLHSILSR